MDSAFSSGGSPCFLPLELHFLEFGWAMNRNHGVFGLYRRSYCPFTTLKTNMAIAGKSPFLTGNMRYIFKCFLLSIVYNNVSFSWVYMGMCIFRSLYIRKGSLLNNQEFMHLNAAQGEFLCFCWLDDLCLGLLKALNGGGRKRTA